jgi:hypothetical protein
MFQPDRSQRPIQIYPSAISPPFRGGVAPLRYEVALSAYIEKQAARRRTPAAQHTAPTIARNFWRVVLEAAALRLTDAVRHPEDRRFGVIRRLRGEIR